MLYKARNGRVCVSGMPVLERHSKRLLVALEDENYLPAPPDSV